MSTNLNGTDSRTLEASSDVLDLNRNLNRARDFLSQAGVSYDVVQAVIKGFSKCPKQLQFFMNLVDSSEFAHSSKEALQNKPMISPILKNVKLKQSSPVSLTPWVQAVQHKLLEGVPLKEADFRLLIANRLDLDFSQASLALRVIMPSTMTTPTFNQAVFGKKLLDAIDLENMNALKGRYKDSGFEFLDSNEYEHAYAGAGFSVPVYAKDALLLSQRGSNNAPFRFQAQNGNATKVDYEVPPEPLPPAARPLLKADLDVDASGDELRAFTFDSYRTLCQDPHQLENRLKQMLGLGQ